MSIQKNGRRYVYRMNVRLSKEDLELLNTLSKATGLSRSHVIRLSMRFYAKQIGVA